jgi:tRNA pseudouridine13 synthase
MDRPDPTAGLPLVSPELPGTGGRIKEQPAHFVVEELPLYQPSGQGAHLYLRLERSGLSTRQVVDRLAAGFGVRPGEIGYAGLKDKLAVAVQSFSLPAAGLEPGSAARRAEELGFDVRGAALHGNKLKQGHLLGNRFRVLVSGVEPDAGPRAEAIARALAERGLPNFFGPQRFGAEGDNAEAGRQVLLGGGPRQKWLRKLLLSAYQSELFNRWLARRLEGGDFARLLAGDVAKKTDTGGIFVVEDPAAEQPRLDAGEITYTGPMFGAKMRAAQGPAGEREAAVLAGEGLEPERFKRAGISGDRRPARLVVGEIGLEAAEAGLWLDFTLPKGAYATTLVREFTKAG